MRVYVQDGPTKAAKVVADPNAFAVHHHLRNSQTFCQEAVIWKRLNHPNIVPLLGITISHFQLISKWMCGSDLLEYVKERPDVDRLELVGVHSLYLFRTYARYQLSDVAKGLCYLHSCNVIHGDLKGVRDCFKPRFTTVLTPHQPNILMNDSGHACIADFGLAKVALDPDSVRSALCQNGYTPRWTAPEVMNGGPCSKEADSFSFAMVMIEVRH